MKVFEVAGVVFNADNVCSIQKTKLHGEREENPVIQVVTNAGGINLVYDTEEERDKNFSKLISGLEKL